MYKLIYALTATLIIFLANRAWDLARDLTRDKTTQDPPPQVETPSPTPDEASPTPEPTTVDPPPSDRDIAFRGVWVASVYNLDYPSRPGLSVDELKREATDILEGVADIGFTAVILQVRPTADALYASDIFPWSDWLSETQGAAPAEDFDPLAYWVEEAHARGLELHAWINPFRIAIGTPSEPRHDPGLLAETHPARLNPSWTVGYTDGNLYFNPGLPEVRQLVIDGVLELVQSYDIDGIHFDDYFYPGLDFGDQDTFETYGADFDDIGDWRRDCVDALIRDTGAAVGAARSGCRFGVSPVGIWANRKSHVLGSDTAGYEGFFTSCADSRRWVKSEWVDYICPQIYWHIGHAVADY
ncbi:MAG: family 10 glycosylhydrolase, partial [Oscillospiraceae bacterium]|nr:family 10 glycosylhydrolase [Oscillospiraceae bacterium]